MENPAKRAATYEEILGAPEHLVAEIMDGELLLSPRPAKPHAAAATALGEELGPPFKRGRGGPGGWILIDEPARLKRAATDRCDSPLLSPREISSRSWNVSPLPLRFRAGGEMPPVAATNMNIDPGGFARARPISLSDCPALQRRQRSALFVASKPRLRTSIPHHFLQSVV